MSTVSGGSAAVAEIAAKNGVITSGTSNITGIAAVSNASDSDGVSSTGGGSSKRHKKTALISGSSPTPPSASPLLGTITNATVESQANADYRFLFFLINFYLKN